MRRPLAVTMPSEDEILNATLTSLFFRDVFPHYAQYTHQPKIKVSSVDDIARLLGFAQAPHAYRCAYPEKALPGQHPTTFLQWGWARRGNKQIVLDIGDANTITRFHFVKMTKDSPWHLDALHIDTGTGQPLKIPCSSDPNWNAQRAAFMLGIATAIASLNQDNWQHAQNVVAQSVRMLIHGPESAVQPGDVGLKTLKTGLRPGQP